MKSLLPKIFLFIFAVVLFSSCQHACPAYSNINTKKMPKTDFEKEQMAIARR